MPNYMPPRKESHTKKRTDSHATAGSIFSKATHRKITKSPSKTTSSASESDVVDRQFEGSDNSNRLVKGILGWADGYSHKGDSEESKELHVQIRDLEAELERQERVINDLHANLTTETKSRQQIKDSANKMQYAMESKELFVGRQDSDDIIYSRFQTLVGQIKTWSVPFAQGQPNLQGDISTAATEYIRRVAPGIVDKRSFEGLLERPKNIRLFVRGYVGSVMADTLFRTLPHGTPGSFSSFSGTDVWMNGRLVQPVSVLEETLFKADRTVVSTREFQDWRVLTTTLVSRFDGWSKTGQGMESHVTECCGRIMEVVGPWVGKRERRSREEELLVILFSAVSLAKTLRCQRAQWSVRHVIIASATDTDILFDGETMEDKHGEEDSDGEEIPTADGKRVEIVVSPGLFKRGNTDGECFEYESCIERAEVKCQ
ncbi:MAG: hypothetical protein Q9168_006580 [Polycauliona sp. 1 TL-2023]